MKQVAIEDFAVSFGTSSESFSQSCRRMIEKKDFSYEILEGDERDAVILEVLKKIESDPQVKRSFGDYSTPRRGG